MSSGDIWSDFDTIRHNVKHNTVDRLKQIILSFNEQCGTNFTKSGKKQELIDRITRELDLWRRTNSSERWIKAKTILNQARNMYTSFSTNGTYSVSATPYNATTLPAPHYHQPTPGTSTLPRYDPYAPPRRPAVPPASATATTASTSTTPSIQFKHSPFFRVERAVSGVQECPESTSQMDRRQSTLTFYITSDIMTKLESKSSRYQLRLYCTSSTYYSPTSAFRPNQGLCPIEFPPTCEVRVNNVALTANLKGMKKKPGTAPPPDIAKNLRLANGASNRVDMVYVNSQNPVPHKKYFLVVMLVEVTTVEQLIDRLRKGKYRSSNDILTKMIQSSAEDDDIVAGHQKMSLKCPLSYMRIQTPCRSAQCVHSQCFDAFSWYSVMEQTTTWLCPVCEKVLNTEDLIVDGYFDEILQGTDEEVEDVIVEANGEWHTADNVYGSASWRAAHPPVKDPTVSIPPTPVKKRSPTPVKPLTNGDAPPKSGPSNAEIVILDSDDEEEVSIGSLPPRSQTVESDVIDLTLDSDDEDTVVSVPNPKKRKSDDRDVVSPSEQIWKKSRVDLSPTAVLASPSPVTPVPYTNGTTYSPPSRDPALTLPPPSPSRYSTSNYAARPASSSYSSPYIPPGSAPLPARPSTTSYSNSPPYLAQPNGGPSSSSGW